MARVRRAAVAGGIAGLDARAREFPVEGARRFLTIPPEAGCWKAGDLQVLLAPIDAALRGSFVRLEPPPDATDEDVANVRRRCEAAGAVRVFALPRRRAAEVLAPQEAVPYRTAREVVLEIVEESAAADKPALFALVEEIMARRGL